MRLLRLLIAALCTVAALALPGLAGSPAQAAAGPPQTVPALRQWTAAAARSPLPPPAE
ncbi:hypothetical protein ACFQ0T_40935 [Kitasatospora gansuensis]